MIKRVAKILLLLLVIQHSLAQEFESRVTVNSSRVSSQVDKKVFQTLQTGLQNFLNNRKWTSETYQPNERIVCSFLLNIEKAIGTNVFQATLTVQAARPVYNSAYQSALINHMDEAISFKYVEFQPIEFNENRVQGTDPIVANLTAVFAYYAYIILALDHNSFALRGGDPYFQKAQNIVNNAPENRDIVGWRPFDGLRNRYWLIENFTNNRYNLIHDALYNYYRLGLDQMFDHEADARMAIMNALIAFNSINNEFPNIMFIQFFFQGKGSEIANIFKRGTPDEKSRALEILSKVDVSNLNQYKQDLL